MSVFTYIHEDLPERFHIGYNIFYYITFREKKKAAGTLDRTPAAIPFILTHIDPQKSLRRNDFFPDFGRGV